MKKNIFLLLGFVTGYMSVGAQAVINTTGGAHNDQNIVYEWSIGELALINEMQSPENSVIVTNGFLQTYSINLQPSDEKDSVWRWLPFNSGRINIFPNPTKGRFQLNFSFNETGKLKVMIVDGFGCIVYKKEMRKSQAYLSDHVNIEGLANGTYFVVVELLSDYFVPKKMKSFKIIKIH